MKLINESALAHIWLLLKEKFVRKELKTGSTSEYKVLSDNNLTDELVRKISNAGDSSFTGNYEDLSNKPDLTAYVKKSDLVAITNDEIDELFADTSEQ